MYLPTSLPPTRTRSEHSPLLLAPAVMGVIAPRVPEDKFFSTTCCCVFRYLGRGEGRTPALPTTYLGTGSQCIAGVYARPVPCFCLRVSLEPTVPAFIVVLVLLVPYSQMAKKICLGLDS
jgi:hypothetical protein